MKLLILLAFVTGGWQLNTSQNLETKTVDISVSVSAPVLQPAPAACVGQARAACVGRTRAACVGRARARACVGRARVRFLFRGRRFGGC